MPRPVLHVCGDWGPGFYIVLNSSLKKLLGQLVANAALRLVTILPLVDYLVFKIVLMDQLF